MSIGVAQAMSEQLLAQIVQRRAGICLYGFAPPKRATPSDELALLAARQVHRLRTLKVDGVVIYDIQDEVDRTSEPRPFPFLPTVPPDEYARDYLGALELPKVVYRCVANDTRESFLSWLARANASASIYVLVGAPSRNATEGLGLKEAYALARAHAPTVMLGAIAIAERHERGLDEHERMLAKAEAGCHFFVTQAVYDVTSTLSLLSDYSLALRASGAAPKPIVLTFAPCGSLKTLAFMKWLGICFPRWLENELRYAKDPLETSLDLCERIFLEVWGFARDKGIPVGVNVESVSIRSSEIEASMQLIATLRGHMEPSR